MSKILAFLAFWLLLISACSSQTIDRSLDQNAIISYPNEGASGLVRKAIATTLNGAQIQIADNAFRESSFLSVHRTHLLGRERISVHTFRLVKNTSDCFLIYENTGARDKLSGLNCAYNN